MIRRIRDLRRLVESVAAPYGATAMIKPTNGSHLRVTFAIGPKHEFIIVGFSPSDRHVNRHIKADARRTLKKLMAEAIR